MRVNCAMIRILKPPSKRSAYGCIHAVNSRGTISHLCLYESRFLQTAIAKEIGVHKSTISRELRRNRGKKGYRPKQAHAMAVERRTKANKFVKLTPQVIALINECIRRDFSPEHQHFGGRPFVNKKSL